MFWIGAAIVALIIAFWVIWGRPLLRRQPWAQGFFSVIEPIEIALWQKSETILWARFLQALGILSSTLSFLGTLDLTPLYAILPDRYHFLIPALPLVISIIGRIEEVLRRDVTKPLIEVAASESTLEKVADKVVQAQEAKAEVVAAIVKEETKAAEAPIGDSP